MKRQPLSRLAHLCNFRCIALPVHSNYLAVKRSTDSHNRFAINGMRTYLTLVTCLLLSACATDDASSKRSTPTPPVKNTPVKKPSGNTNQSVITTAKARTIPPPQTGTIAQIDDIVIQHKSRGKPQVLAAVGGGLDRATMSEYMAQQIESLQRALQNEIEQGEIQVEQRATDGVIRVSMTPIGGFDNLSSVVKPGFLASLSKIAPVLDQYGKTLLTVIGYIERAGTDAGNQKLAERRAKSVSDYFINQNIEAIRLQSYARVDPTRGDNPTGSQPVRRVELWIQPVFAQ